MWRDRKENVVSRACGKGEGGGLLSDGFRVSVWDNEKVLEIDGGNGCRTVQMT